MKYKYKTCIMLTACVNPRGMSHTVLQDTTIRANQYKESLDFYLKETKLPIVFCENTLFDFSNEYKSYIANGRLEYLTFEGNNYDTKKGKGYGEAIIMKYALDNSYILKQCKYVLKITGRLIIKDISRYESSILYSFENLFRSNIKKQFISTYFFIARPNLVLSFVNKYKEHITEDSPQNELIEHHWFRALSKDDELNKILYLPFFRIPKVMGISGTTGKPYTMENRLSGNLVCTSTFEKERQNTLLSYLYIWFYYLINIKELLGVLFLKIKA